jgi:predicted ArsR family transcriptional regulator
MARPVSDAALDLMAALIDGPGTCRQLAQRTGLAVSATRTALDNMVRRGDATADERVRVPGVKRPVPVYARAQASDDASDGPCVPDLIAVWAGIHVLDCGVRA